MMKKQKTKEMTGTERTVKQKQTVDAPEISAPVVPEKILCIRECEMPGVGHFKHGEIIEDKGKIARIADNPNFQVVKED